MSYFTQVFLELEDNTVYKASEITSELLKEYPNLGNEVILPINMQEKNKGIPIFVFSQNPDFQIQSNFYNLILTVSDKFNDKLDEITKSIFRIFTDKKINFVGIACTFQEPIDNEKMQPFKAKHFVNFDTINDDKIHFSMLREININGRMTRCLEGYSTLDDDFVLHFEFNMKRKDFEPLDINYIMAFLHQSAEYKENKKLCL